jgi:hypothetical protein
MRAISCSGVMPFLLGAQHHRCAVRVARRTRRGSRGAAQALEAHPDVGLDLLDDVPEMQRTVGVRQCTGDEDTASGWHRGHDPVCRGGRVGKRDNSGILDAFHRGK